MPSSPLKGKLNEIRSNFMNIRVVDHDHKEEEKTYADSSLNLDFSFFKFQIHIQPKHTDQCGSAAQLHKY